MRTLPALLTRIAILALPGIALVSRPLPAQTFEAASIKLSAPGAVGSTFEFLPGGGIRIVNGTLRQILETAYSLRDFEILGVPAWLNSARYDILAKGGNAPTNDDVTGARLKLRTLLAERFQLRVHNETAELPMYALVPAKNGPKLMASGPSVASASRGIQTACGTITGTHTTMANLAVYLARQFHRPVADRTGLPGNYDFRIEWTPDEGPCPGASGDAPSIFTALQEGLGLRLESIKGPQEVLVVDSAERAGEN